MNTPVEFLLEQFEITSGHPTIQKVIKQAKEMEKQSIIDAYWEGCSNWDNDKEAEQYYNEKFKKDE
jgi:hypothetical protein